MAGHADARGAHVIANPSANPWPWEKRWVYADSGSDMLRSEQWRNEGLAATLGQLERVRYGVTAHLCGGVLDVEFAGQSEILCNDSGRVRALARASSHLREDLISARVPVPRVPVPGSSGEQSPG